MISAYFQVEAEFLSDHSQCLIVKNLPASYEGQCSLQLLGEKKQLSSGSMFIQRFKDGAYKI